MINSNANQLETYLSSLSMQVHEAMKKMLSGLLDIFNFSLPIMYFQSHFGSFCRRFWRILYFCDNNGPLSNVTFIIAPYILNTLSWTEDLNSWNWQHVFKIVNFTEQLSQITRAKEKIIKKRIIKIRRLFCAWLTSRKSHILRLRRLVIPLLTKTLIILKTNVKCLS